MAQASDHHRPGEPPPIQDEAADTPMWLPLVGLALLLIGAFLVIWQTATGEDETAVLPAPAAVDAPADADDAPAAEGDAPAQPAAE